MLTVGERELGELDPRLRRIVSLFGGGVGGTHEELCGALSAGVMIIGALYGRSSLGEDEQFARRLAALWRERFLAEFGHTQCEALREPLRALDGSVSCTPLVERATLLFLELLREAAGQLPAAQNS
jgi:C_GCAxxG_C_C family probable redox protein